MKPIEEFENAIESAIKAHPEIDYRELADSLEYYANDCLMRANRE